jgi:hypothetical protein
MKRVVRFASIVVVLVTIGALAASAQESLAQAAKNAQAAKKKSPATKVYTNDDFASPVIMPAAEKATETSAPASETKADNKDAQEEKSDEKAKAAADMKKVVADQQAKIKDAERELDLMEREHQVRVAAYYADAGNQLRDSTKWFADEKKYNDDLAAKKKGLSDAKDKLAELQEAARKSGIPLRQVE